MLHSGSPGHGPCWIKNIFSVNHITAESGAGGQAELSAVRIETISVEVYSVVV